jgi:hypothetical protein
VAGNLIAAFLREFAIKEVIELMDGGVTVDWSTLPPFILFNVRHFSPVLIGLMMFPP